MTDYKNELEQILKHTVLGEYRGIRKWEVWRDGKETDLVQELEALLSQHSKKRELELLGRIASDDDGEIFICYFDEDTSCDRDISLNDRINQLTNGEGDKNEYIRTRTE